MRQDLMPQDDRVLGLQSQGPLDRQWPKAVERAVNREIARGIHGAARAQAAGYVAAARVDAAELVTERSMLGVHRLNQLKRALKPADPLEADDYDSLVRDFALVARLEVRNLPRQW